MSLVCPVNVSYLVGDSNIGIERQLSEMNPASHVTQSPVIHSGLNPGAAERDNIEASSEQSRLPPSAD